MRVFLVKHFSVAPGCMFSGRGTCVRKAIVTPKTGVLWRLTLQVWGKDIKVYRSTPPNDHA